MKKLSKIFAGVAAGALLATSLGLAACGGSSEQAADEYTLIEDGVLTVATSPDFMPFEYIGTDGEITGYDIAIINEVGNRLGLEVKFNPMSFDAVVEQVAGGASADIGVSGLTITDERLELVDFTDPYYDSNLAIVVRGDSELADRAAITDDLTIGGQSGSTGEDWAKENLSANPYVPYQEVPDALAALRVGQVDALVFDAPVAEQYTQGEYSDLRVLEVIATGDQLGFAVNKDNPGLTAAINEVLAEMQADGTIDSYHDLLFVTE